MINNSIEGRFAGLYDLSFNLVLRQVYNTIAKLAKKYNCKSIIDLGSGTGTQAKILASQGFSVIGVDASSKMIDVALKKTNAQIKFINEDIASIIPNANIFDAANLSLVLHSNSIKKIDEILTKANSLIKDNGVIFITDYSIGNKLYGKIANNIIKIIESFANNDHKNNYISFIKQNGTNMFSSRNDIKIIEKKSYFYGALETIMIKFIIEK